MCWPPTFFGHIVMLGAYTSLLPGDHRDPYRLGSVGRPLPGAEVRAADPRTGVAVEAGAVGERWVNTAAHIGEKCLHTRDLAHLSGRLKDATRPIRRSPTTR